MRVGSAIAPEVCRRGLIAVRFPRCAHCRYQSFWGAGRHRRRAAVDTLLRPQLAPCSLQSLLPTQAQAPPGEPCQGKGKPAAHAARPAARPAVAPPRVVLPAAAKGQLVALLAQDLTGLSQSRAADAEHLLALLPQADASAAARKRKLQQVGKRHEPVSTCTSTGGGSSRGAGIGAMHQSRDLSRDAPMPSVQRAASASGGSDTHRHQGRGVGGSGRRATGRQSQTLRPVDIDSDSDSDSDFDSVGAQRERGTPPEQGGRGPSTAERQRQAGSFGDCGTVAVAAGADADSAGVAEASFADELAAFQRTFPKAR